MSITNHHSSVVVGLNESSAPDFRALFESAPGLYVVMTPSFEVVAASDAYLKATMTTRVDLVGRSLFDVFLDNPDQSAATSVRELTASVKRVLRDRRPDGMNSPVLGERGEVLYIIHRLEDRTAS